MRAGQLRHRVTIQERGTTQDEYGAPIEEWTNVTTDWANVEPLRGMERHAAKHTEASADVKVTMRYRSGVTSTNRLKFGSRIFDIESPINIGEANRTLEIFCKEAV